MTNKIYEQFRGKKFYFLRVDEPRESAFTLLVSRGWILEGGAVRLLSDQIAGASNGTEGAGM